MSHSEEVAERMGRAVAVLGKQLGKIRSGRAHAGLLDAVVVNCYGAEMPIAQVATVTVADARTLTVAVWDKQNVAAVEKAILEADLGVNPAADGQSVRIPLPPLSEERRRELTKLVGKELEKAKVGARSIRHEELETIRRRVKSKELSEDDGRRLEKALQKATDEAVASMEGLSSEKQKELMTV